MSLHFLKALILFFLSSFGFGFGAFFRYRFFAHHDSHSVRLLIIYQRKIIRCLFNSIQLDTKHTAANRHGFFNTDAIDRAATPVGDLKVSPPTRHTRIDAQTLALVRR